MNLWSSTVGHERTKDFLSRALTAARLPHALLFVGPDSIGKKRLAYGLAQKISCQTKSSCGSCGPCLRILNKQSENVLEIQAEGAQIKIDQIRKAIQFFSLKLDKESRFVIIDEVQKLNSQAANALLKTLEEPPQSCYIFMTAPSSLSVLSTLRSRSQVLRMSPLSKQELGRIPELKDTPIVCNYGGVKSALLMADPESSEVNKEAFNSLSQLLEGQEAAAFKTVQLLVKDSDKSLQVVRVWSQLFRDAWINKGREKNFIYKEEKELSLKLGALPAAVLESITNETLKMEGEILGHLDRGLVFESFFGRAHNVLGQV